MSQELWHSSLNIVFKTSLIISFYSILGKFKPLDLKHGMWILHIQHSAEAIKLVPLLA